LDGFYGGGRHQGVVARVAVKSLGDSLDEILEPVEQPLVLVLDGVTDPHNLGACLRVANAAGAHAVIAPKDRAAGITPAVSKVASGAAEATPYLMVTNLARTLAELTDRNIWIVGADERAETTLDERNIPEAVARLPYDPVKDFAPITLIASAPSVLVVHPSVPARTLAEFTALAKASPGRINYASNGNGSSAQLAAVLYESMAGVRMVHVPYKGLAPALVDLFAGEVQAMFSSVVAIVPSIKAGRLRALAVTGTRR